MAENTVTPDDRAAARDRLYIKSEQLEAVTKAMSALESAGQSDLVGELTYLAEDLAGEVQRLLPLALRELTPEDCLQRAVEPAA